jgi:hypothetical protein
MPLRHLLMLFLTLTLLLSLSAQASVRVSLPNGELRASVTDLRVKVRGGQVAVERTWSNGRWYLNPAWADLRFRFNSEDGSVRYVDRAGAVYEKLGTGNVYVYDDRFFVAQTSTGWRSARRTRWVGQSST